MKKFLSFLTKKSLLLILFSVLLISCDKTQVGSGKKTDKPKVTKKNITYAMSDIKSNPYKTTPVYEKRKLRSRIVEVIASSPGGLTLGLQYFSIDPITKKSGAHVHSRYSSMIYDNTIIDSIRFSSFKRLKIGNLVRVKTEKHYCCINVFFEKYKQVFISPDHIVFPVVNGQKKETLSDKKKVYYADLFFDPLPSEDSKGKTISGKLTVLRNGNIISNWLIDDSKILVKNLDYYKAKAVSISETGFHIIKLSHVNQEKDLVEWVVESNGLKTHKGLIGFPVLGTVPGIVGYEITIRRHANN